MDADLHRLVRDAWHHHALCSDQSWLVRPSAPVLYFGNLRSYLNSRLRVATVALNPSRIEFPSEQPFLRFPNAESAKPDLYINALNGYFTTNPYWQWFNSLQAALKGMRTSYSEEYNSVALHTDMASVLPTDPTWSKLDPAVKTYLAGTGIELWHRLIEFLKPDILLLSGAREWRGKIKFKVLSNWKTIHIFLTKRDGSPMRRPVAIEVSWRRANSSKKQMLVAFVPGQIKPLGNLTDEKKFLCGEIIRAHWENRLHEMQ